VAWDGAEEREEEGGRVKRIRVGKAEAITGLPVPSVVLEISGAPLQWHEKEALSERRAYYDREAEKILAALGSLPGGTWDALLVAMLRRHQSVLSVQARGPYERPRKRR
jgi:hypothetical protein